MTAEWPATIRERQVVDANKTDRPDGYDWSAHLRFTYTNDEQTDWHLSGSLWQRDEGLEWTTDFDAANLPPNVDATKMLQRLEAKVTYGGEPATVAAQDMRPAMVETTATLADGQTTTTKKMHLLSTRARELSVEEVLATVSGAAAHLPFSKGFNAEDFEA